MRKTFRRFLLAGLALLFVFLAACSSAPQHADLQEVYGKILELPEMPEMISLSEKRIESYYGIDTASCPQAIVAICGDGLRVDEIWLIEAPSEKEAEHILDLASKRVGQVCDETENYLPEQYAVAQQARTLRTGCYVALFLSPDAEAMDEILQESFSS